MNDDYSLSPEDFDQHIGAMEEAGQGILVVKVWQMSEMAGLIERRLKGSDEAAVALTAIDTVLNTFIKASKTAQPLLCITCDAAMVSPTGILLLLPDTSVPPKPHIPGLSGVVCEACCCAPDFKRRVLAVMQESVFPDQKLKELSVHHTAGRA